MDTKKVDVMVADICHPLPLSQSSPEEAENADTG